MITENNHKNCTKMNTNKEQELSPEMSQKIKELNAFLLYYSAVTGEGDNMTYADAVALNAEIKKIILNN